MTPPPAKMENESQKIIKIPTSNEVTTPQPNRKMKVMLPKARKPKSAFKRKVDVGTDATIKQLSSETTRDKDIEILKPVYKEAADSIAHFIWDILNKTKNSTMHVPEAFKPLIERLAAFDQEKITILTISKQLASIMNEQVNMKSEHLIEISNAMIIINKNFGDDIKDKHEHFILPHLNQLNSKEASVIQAQPGS